MKPNIKHLVLSGGGLSCITQIGVYKYIYENNMLNDLENIICSSGGTLIGLNILFKKSIKVILKDIINLFSSNFQDVIDISFNTFKDLLDNYGLFDISLINNIIDIIFEKNGLNSNITFKQLYEYYPINYIVSGTNITKKKIVYFSHLTYPNMPVKIAIGISCSIPILFTPILYEYDYYIDGCVFGCIPAQYLIDMYKLDDVDTDNSIKEDIYSSTLIISISNHDKIISNLLQYVMYIMSLYAFSSMYDNSYSNQFRHTIYIDANIPITDLIQKKKLTRKRIKNYLDDIYYNYYITKQHFENNTIVLK